MLRITSPTCFLVMGTLALGCTTPEVHPLPEPDSGLPDASPPTRPDAGRDGGPVARDAALPDAATPDGGGDAATPDGGSGLRLCSADPLRTVRWSCDADGLCEEVAVVGEGCPVGWGCGDFASGLAAVSSECSETGSDAPVRAAGCGYDVIEQTAGPGVPTRAFYDPESGELIGTWSMLSDVLPADEECSGRVPEECLDLEGLQLTDYERICEPIEAGAPDPDAGNPDAGELDAG